ncbi:MAG: TrkH family potassium uptake protein [Alphaproteobacteria bacterium]|nr:TrkH family potassium uptake protein [Alphaproteobacteria bacterium]
MRFGIVAFISGLLLSIFGAAMLIPAAFDFMYDGRSAHAFAYSAVISIFFGLLLTASSYHKWQKLTIKEMFLTTSCVWLLVVLFSALPFYFSGENINYPTAFFEAMSGLTSTGATALAKLDDLPKGILLWRAMMQWIGGLGIVMIAIAILPMLKVGGMQMFMTESSGKLEAKAIPRTSQVISFIIGVYLFFTLCCIIMLYLAGMSFFDAVAHAMTCISTGGFSTHSNSIGYYASPEIEWILIVFMIIGAIPFIAYYFLFVGYFEKFIKDTQIKTFIAAIAVISGALSSWLIFTDTGTDSFTLIRQSVFNVVSIITTTGYSINNYELWGSFAVIIFFFLTLSGGCAGSSTGGIKIFRFNILFLNLLHYLKNMIYPHGVFTEHYNGRPLTEEIVNSVVIFVSIFFISIVFLTLALSLTGLDLITSLTGAMSALANTGPGLGSTIGPAGNFSSLPDTAKWLLSLGMMLGRLEFTTVMVLLIPMTWKSS